MRNFLDNQITTFNKTSNRSLSESLDLSIFDTKFFSNENLEEVMFVFVYCIEKIIKYYTEARVLNGLL